MKKSNLSIILSVIIISIFIITNFSFGEDALFIKENGNVGIGTMSPNELLHVYDSAGSSGIFLGGSSSGGPHGIVFDDDTAGAGVQLFWRTSPNQLIIEKSSGGTGSDGTDMFSYDRDTDYFYFGGNVGIGTISPGGKLHIYQNNGADLINYIHNADTTHGAYLTIKANDATPYAATIYQGTESNWWVGNAGSTNFLIYDATNSRYPFIIEQGAATNSYRIDSSGNVGIGTTSPGAKLDVAGDIEFNGKKICYCDAYTVGPEIHCRKKRFDTGATVATVYVGLTSGITVEGVEGQLVTCSY